MRLLHTHTLTFHEYMDEREIPVYAILSHVWEPDQEVSYKEMLERSGDTVAKRGFDKIRHCAELASEDGIDYFWVDTCCIDKSSSAELSEAINSMFRWYQNSAVCYVYLYDTILRRWQSLDHTWRAMEGSRWFSRGWTLQELIAPSTIVFYTRDWRRAATKAALVTRLKEATGIPYQILLTGDVSTASVAQRMSWASDRETTRAEDLAYCLLGLFDVNIPLLYGEGGTKAFIRLQEEIIRTSDDMSIFAWVEPASFFSQYSGLLATRPGAFEQCKNVVWDSAITHTAYQMTNKGVKIDLELQERPKMPEELRAYLPGVSIASPGSQDKAVGVYLVEVGTGQYARVDTDSWALHKQSKVGNETYDRDQNLEDEEDPEEQHTEASYSDMTTIFVRQKLRMDTESHSRAAGIKFRYIPPWFDLMAVVVDPAVERTILESQTDKRRWDEALELFLFDGAMALEKPPIARASFRGKDTGVYFDLIIDASQPWGFMLSIQTWPTELQFLSSSKHSIRCEVPSHGSCVISIHRGLWNNQSLLIVDMKS